MAIIYEPHTSLTDTSNLLDLLRAFLVSRSWTVNSWTTSGSGKRLHVQKGSDMFFNFRSLVNEYAQSGVFGGQVYGLALNGSTGYNGASAWYGQPGAPVDAGGRYRVPGIVGIPGAINAAHFFSIDDTMIYVFVEYASGLYQWFMFGRPEVVGSWTGAMFIAANADGQSNSNASIPRCVAGRSSVDITGNANAYLYGTFDGVTGWAPAGVFDTLSPATPKVFDSIELESVIATNKAITFLSRSADFPVRLYVTRDGTGNRTNSTNFSLEAYLPEFYSANLRHLIPASEQAIATDVYRVFPCRQRTDSGVGGSGWMGFAVKAA